MDGVCSSALMRLFACLRAVVIRTAARDTISLCYRAEIVGNGCGVFGQVGSGAVVTNTLVIEVLRIALVRPGSLIAVVKAQRGTLASLRGTPSYLGRLRNCGDVLCVGQSREDRSAGKSECKENGSHRV